MTFVCNICSAKVSTFATEDLDRESGACPHCGAHVRLRALGYLAGKVLFGAGGTVADWPERRDLVAYGISDWPAFSTYFSPKIDYVNTQYDRDLYSEQLALDVTEPPAELIGTADLIVCSEVFEHVVQPVQRAFDGLAAILKPGGAVVFSVPYSFEKTREHFPDMHDWHLETVRGDRVLFNTTVAGERQRFDDLVFHGGGDSVLEMRLFGLPALREHFARAGFSSVELMNYNVPEFGIRFAHKWGRPMVAIKGAR